MLHVGGAIKFVSLEGTFGQNVVQQTKQAVKTVGEVIICYSPFYQLISACS